MDTTANRARAPHCPRGHRRHANSMSACAPLVWALGRSHLTTYVVVVAGWPGAGGGGQTQGRIFTLLYIIYAVIYDKRTGSMIMYGPALAADARDMAMAMADK